jgi:Putative peptidase (DUF1758)
MSEIFSCLHDVSIHVEAMTLNKVTGSLPKFHSARHNWSHLAGLDLADPSFNKPGPIDILLQADTTAGIRSGVSHSPIAQNSIFGWILSGRVAVSSTSQHVVRVHHADVTDVVLRKFWELEEMPAVKHMTPGEKVCEQHFSLTHTRNQEGRYVVQLPFKSNVCDLGRSRETAINRWKQVERRLAKQVDRRQQYNQFMREYLDLGHMSPIPYNEQTEDAGKTYYLPHHFVIKNDSTTTKLRVVFDGSAKSSSGVSLNDCLMVGPTIQDDLLSLLLSSIPQVLSPK